MPRTSGGESAGRVCRVRPDLAAVDREFDYVVPEALAEAVRIGTVVRVPLHGRRVRGWVVADGVKPSAGAGRLLALGKVVGAGPPADVVELCQWAAWRWAGSEVALLRAASAPNAVRDPWPVPPAPPVARPGRETLAWPPAADRRELVAERVARDGSTIVLVPEGARLPALVRRLEGDGHRVLLLRAEMSAVERTRAWAAARAGRCVVVGGRIAVWAPVPDLAALVVLDEGDEALQEERAPTWHGRDVAIERARRTGARLTLVGVVPTPEAAMAAGEPRRPDRRVERDGWPLLDVVDLRDEPPGTGLLSEPLAQALHQAIDAGGRAVCVVNRKGRARTLVCRACGELARCERCGSAVAERGGLLLACPQCDAERPRVCLRCHATRVRGVRPGVTRLREDLAALLPRVPVGDVDSATREVPDLPVLVGTEAVLHRLPAGRPLLLAAFLDFDQELVAPRYRAAEQAIGLLARAARLLGPRARGGRLLVQTRLPGHEVIDVVRHADPSRLVGPERARRRELGYPPFGALAEVSGSADALRALLDRLPTALEVLGPTAQSNGLRALVLAATVDALCDALAEAAPPARSVGRLRIAVDPPRV